MSYKLFTAGQLREIASQQDELSLFRDQSQRFWVNSMRKGALAPLVAELHEHEADIYLVLAGTAMLLLGGVIENATISAPGQVRGDRLNGASVHEIQQGDFIIIPPGTPHMVDARNEGLTYLVIKIDSAEALRAISAEEITER